jgi:hemoglobin
MERHGHPRLRMRHGSVFVDAAMRDAWMRCMRKAFEMNRIEGDIRSFLDQKLADLADFLRNTRG